ncbi:MAG TPA: tail fiber domain-containing protein [Thiobacillus sp.]|nr:tail fiber domain-containing protein [Thiobacillus sp.]
MNDRQIALSWTGVAGAVQYRIYVGKNGLPASLYHSSPTNTFTYRSDYGARPGSVPTTTTAYVTKLSAQGSWIPRLVSRGIGGGLELYGDAGRSPGFHIGGPVRGAYREGVLGFALSGGHWAAAAASGDLVMRVQDGSIHFANQSPAYTPRMTIGSDGVLYITPSNLGTPGHPSLRATQFAIGWNVSNGRGETDFYQDHGDGWQGGYDFYAQSGNSTWLLARLRGNGNLSLVGQLNEGSDAREKTNIQPISNALGTIRDLRGVRFNWKDGKARDEKTHLGLVAQEVLRVVPEVVVADDENDEKGGGEKRYGLHYSGLIPILIEAVKEQQQLIDDLKKRLLEVEARLNGAEPVTK